MTPPTTVADRIAGRTPAGSAVTAEPAGPAGLTDPHTPTRRRAAQAGANHQW